MLARLTALALFAATLLGCAGQIVSLDPSSTANYGTFTLVAGYTPNPHRVEVLAGGQIAANGLSVAPGVDCEAGWIDDHPDVRIHLEGSAVTPLHFEVDGRGADTTLAIHAPNGRWYCNDDAGGEDPRIEFPAPQPGRYDIWVGVVRQGHYPEAELLIRDIR